MSKIAQSVRISHRTGINTTAHKVGVRLYAGGDWIALHTLKAQLCKLIQEHSQ